MSTNFQERKGHREVPGNQLFSGRHSGPIDSQRQHFGGASAVGKSRACAVVDVRVLREYDCVELLRGEPRLGVTVAAEWAREVETDRGSNRANCATIGACRNNGGI